MQKTYLTGFISNILQGTTVMFWGSCSSKIFSNAPGFKIKSIWWMAMKWNEQCGKPIVKFQVGSDNTCKSEIALLAHNKKVPGSSPNWDLQVGISLLEFPHDSKACRTSGVNIHVSLISYPSRVFPCLWPETLKHPGDPTQDKWYGK